MSTDRLAELPLSDDPLDTLAYCPAETAGLPISVRPISGEGERDDYPNPTARILVAQSGRGSRWYCASGRTLELQTAPNMMEIYAAGTYFTNCRWRGEAGRCAQIEFTDDDLQAVTYGEVQSLRLQTRHEVFDAGVSRLVLELANDILQGMPNGRLYAQGMCISLIGVLASRYGARDTQASLSKTGCLGPRQRQQLQNLIRGELASDLTLTRLADEVRLTPYHFARAFKATFGTSPHQYILEQRILAAAETLQRPDRRSIAEIALAFGFSSQSHMTHLMRHRLGTTPGSLRRESSARSAIQVKATLI
jgi:AraC family transcriptional regulator